MRLTRFTDYSLRVLMALAVRRGERLTVAELAQALNLPASHLSKVVQRLARDGHVSTMRGKGGGLTLSADPATINLGEVVLATEGAPAQAHCFGPGGRPACTLVEVCRLQGLLDEAAQAFLAALSRHSLQDLIDQGPRLHTLIFTPPEPPVVPGRAASSRTATS